MLCVTCKKSLDLPEVLKMQIMTCKFCGHSFEGKPLGDKFEEVLFKNLWKLYD